MSEFKSLLEYKKSKKDWHYDPSIPSQDCQHIGRFVGEFSDFESVMDGVSDGHAVDIYPEDDLKPLDEDNISWGKKGYLEAGYHEYNTRRYQVTSENFNKFPEFCYKIADMCGLDHRSIAMIKQPPGNVVPWHFDTYKMVRKKHNIDKDNLDSIRRYLIFMEDWHWGHFLQIGNNVLSHWKQGDVYTWPYGMYHLSCNAGITDKWTMQITGLATDQALHIGNKKEFNF